MYIIMRKIRKYNKIEKSMMEWYVRVFFLRLGIDETKSEISTLDGKGQSDSTLIDTLLRDIFVFKQHSQT